MVEATQDNVEEPCMRDQETHDEPQHVTAPEKWNSSAIQQTPRKLSGEKCSLVRAMVARCSQDEAWSEEDSEEIGRAHV